jgi:tetratricopeptide (TPR) repeat protein
VKYYGELIPLRKRTARRSRGGDGTLSNYYQRLAQAHVALNQTVKAVDAASGAIVVWSGNQRNRNQAVGNLRNILKQAQDLDAYSAHLDEQAEESGLENPILRKAVGQVYMEKKQFKKAIRQLSLAVEVQPNDGETHKLLVQAYDRMDDREGALKQMLASIQLSRRDINLYRDIAQRYQKMGDAIRAERAYQSIVEMRASESESHAMLAGIRQGQNRWQDAIHHWKQVHRIRSLEPTGLMKLAEAQIHEKLWPDALRTIKLLQSKEWPSRFSNVDNQVRNLLRRIPREVQ